MFSYRSLFKQAWQISWKNKYLWFFGLFASLLSAGGGLGLLSKNLGANYSGDFWTGVSSLLDIKFFYQSVTRGFADLFKSDWLFALDNIIVLILIALIILFIIWLAVACQGGLISHVQRILKHKKKDSLELSLKDGLAAGHQKFWPLLSLNIIFKVLINFAFLIISIPFLFIALSDSGLLGLAYIILFIIFVPVAIALNLIIKYAMAYNVLEHNTFATSIENAWRLFKKNWLISMEMLIALFVVDFLAGLIVLIFLSIFILPLFIVGATFSLAWLSALMILLAIIVIVISGALIATFEGAGWVSLFIRLEEKGGVAKLERIFRKKSHQK